MSFWEILAVVVYLLIVAYLGCLGWRRTKSASDYMLAGRKAHPVIMALSYGATFISTSAIVGFGGVAGMFGMSLLWLTFLNIFVGIFIAFVVMGGPARRIGPRLDAHTFPELLGRRYESKFIQVFAGLVIFLFMPLYAAAVIIGGTEFIATQFRDRLHPGPAGLRRDHGRLRALRRPQGRHVHRRPPGRDHVRGHGGAADLGVRLVGGVTQGHQDLTAMTDGVRRLQGHRPSAAGRRRPTFGWGRATAKPHPTTCGGSSSPRSCWAWASACWPSRNWSCGS